jgi:hypothetical protein
VSVHACSPCAPMQACRLPSSQHALPKPAPLTPQAPGASMPGSCGIERAACGRMVLGGTHCAPPHALMLTMHTRKRTPRIMRECATHTHTDTDTHTHTHTHTQTHRPHRHSHTLTHTRTYACTHTHVCVHTHTHTHTHTRARACRRQSAQWGLSTADHPCLLASDARMIGSVVRRHSDADSEEPRNARLHSV